MCKCFDVLILNIHKLWILVRLYSSHNVCIILLLILSTFIFVIQFIFQVCPWLHCLFWQYCLIHIVIIHKIVKVGHNGMLTWWRTNTMFYLVLVGVVFATWHPFKIYHVAMFIMLPCCLSLENYYFSLIQIRTNKIRRVLVIFW